MSCKLMERGNDAGCVVMGHVREKRERTNTRAVPFRVRKRYIRETLAVVFLRMCRTEMQAGSDALLLQRGHQGITREAAPGLIHANDKQVPGVQMRPGRNAQRLERGIREFKQVA